MEFFILQNVEVDFAPVSSTSAAGIITRRSELVEVEIEETKTDDGTENHKFSKELTTALVENPWNFKKKKDMTDWNLEVAISLPDPSSEVRRPSDTSGNLKVYVNYVEGVDNFLEILHDNFNFKVGDGRNVTVNVTVKNFGPKKKSLGSPASVNWKAKGILLDECWEIGNEVIGSVGCSHQPLLPEPEKRLLVAWKNGVKFSGIFTISVVLNSSALSLLTFMNHHPKGGYDHFKKLLESEICTDLAIICGVGLDQKVVKCHRAILAAGSKVFQGMFESGMKEATGNRIEIKDMSENGVRALLAYLYHRDIKAAYESSEIALELLEAGEKYDIPVLRNVVQDYMMAKEYEWFEVDVVLALYVFVRALCSKKEEEIADEEEEDIKMDVEKCDNEGSGEWKSLKIKCLRVLKWYMRKKTKTLLESVKYQEIFGGGNLKLATEITAGIARLD